MLTCFIGGSTCCARGGFNNNKSGAVEKSLIERNMIEGDAKASGLWVQNNKVLILLGRMQTSISRDAYTVIDIQ